MAAFRARCEGIRRRRLRSARPGADLLADRLYPRDRPRAADRPGDCGGVGRHVLALRRRAGRCRHRTAARQHAATGSRALQVQRADAGAREQEHAPLRACGRAIGRRQTARCRPACRGRLPDAHDGRLRKRQVRLRRSRQDRRPTGNAGSLPGGDAHGLPGPLAEHRPGQSCGAEPGRRPGRRPGGGPRTLSGDRQRHGAGHGSLPHEAPRPHQQLGAGAGDRARARASAALPSTPADRRLPRSPGTRPVLRRRMDGGGRGPDAAHRRPAARSRQAEPLVRSRTCRAPPLGRAVPLRRGGVFRRGPGVRGLASARAERPDRGRARRRDERPCGAQAEARDVACHIARHHRRALWLGAGNRLHATGGGPALLVLLRGEARAARRGPPQRARRRLRDADRDCPGCQRSQGAAAAIRLGAHGRRLPRRGTGVSPHRVAGPGGRRLSLRRDPRQPAGRRPAPGRHPALQARLLRVAKFDPKSDLWTRVNMFQGAPLPHEIADRRGREWVFPTRPATPSGEAVG